MSGRGDLSFHATTLAAGAAITGGLAGTARDAVLTVNVIVFGVDEQALPGMVIGRVVGGDRAAIAWRR